MKVNDSAFKHGVSAVDAEHAATWALWIEDLDEESPARQLRLGFDTRGRLLESLLHLSDADPVQLAQVGRDLEVLVGEHPATPELQELRDLWRAFAIPAADAHAPEETVFMDQGISPRRPEEKR